ncbi:MAG: segregation/condensation protein A [Sedimentisphaerales bacterium]|nr:segregation/condensation protein A [Sedimentisphaerales bacterium]
MSEYRVSLDIFSGPLDLLLYLVRKEEVDIYDIPISRITEQYLGYVEILKQIDIELAGDFLVMAATLMEIKSIMLLPTPDVDAAGTDEIGDPRAELVRQLLEYKRFKDAANLLESAAAERELRYTRPDTIIARLKPDAEPEVDLEDISVWALLEAFDRIMQSVGTYQSYDFIEDDTPIDLYQIALLHRLQTEGAITLESVFVDRQNRLVMIGTFMGLLELIRDQLVAAEQSHPEAPIYLRALTEEPAEVAVQNAIYARMAPEEESKHEAAEIPEKPAEVVLESNDDQSMENPDEELFTEEPLFPDDLAEPPKAENTDIGSIGQKAPIPIVEIPPKKHSMQTQEAKEETSVQDVSEPQAHS